MLYFVILLAIAAFLGGQITARRAPSLVLGVAGATAFLAGAVIRLAEGPEPIGKALAYTGGVALVWGLCLLVPISKR